MWIDITHTLSEGVAPWPGDTPFAMKFFSTKDENGSANIGEMTGSNHIGTHMDAAKHVANDGWTMDQVEIERLIGDATVLVFTESMSITREDLQQCSIKGTIVLFKTRDIADPAIFPTTIATLTSDAIDYLADIGVQVVGVDVPSVDPLDSETLENHHRFAHHEMYHIENLRLDDVTAGYYHFIGLPLKIKNADAAYMRAVVSKQ